MEVQGGLQVGRNVAPGQRMQVQRSRVGQMLSNLTTSRVIVGEQRTGTVQGLPPAELLPALHVWGFQWWWRCRACQYACSPLQPRQKQTAAWPVRLSCRWSLFC